MSNNNAPDEAERLLDELLLPVNTHEAQIGRAYTIGHLLPLIRAGLAMQRLENARPAAIKILPDPAGGWIGTIEHPRHHGHSSAGDTIPDAINAALDAAGVEK